MGALVLSRAIMRFNALYARITQTTISAPNIITLVLKPCQSKNRLKQTMKRRPKARAANPSHTVNKPKMIFRNNINKSECAYVSVFLIRLESPVFCRQ
jgi:hypothetical protein